MSERAWLWVVAVSVVATALIGIAGGLDFVRQVVNPERRVERTIECQDSPDCRAFIANQIDEAVVKLQREGVVPGGGRDPSGLGGGEGAPGQDGEQGPPGSQGPPGGSQTPQEPPPSLLEPVCDLGDILGLPLC